MNIKRCALPDLDLWAEDNYVRNILISVGKKLEYQGVMETDDFVQTFYLEVIRCLKYYNPRRKSSFNDFCKRILYCVLYTVRKESKKEKEKKLRTVSIDAFDYDFLPDEDEFFFIDQEINFDRVIDYEQKQNLRVV